MFQDVLRAFWATRRRSTYRKQNPAIVEGMGIVGSPVIAELLLQMFMRFVV